MIYLENVTKEYPRPEGAVTALRSVSLDVAAGEFVAVRGPSGCGKSTLLSIIGGLALPTKGRVVVAGEDLVSCSASCRARFRAQRVGFVFQMFHLLPYLTVVDNVAAASVGERRSTARSRASELLGRFGLGDRLRHRPAELSAGERQRVAIARALINHPDLLLADEPTGNLDAESAADVIRLLSEFHREGGTVLLATHQEAAARSASRTVRLCRGSLEPNGADRAH